ncbi:ionotropic receptor 21a-like [Panulirus ornatus]|uniref:ionotropic receptor 21a-like n=1 Tax=Panulirus ornatus TaxID=150431 RepID=UPI003A865210
MILTHANITSTLLTLPATSQLPSPARYSPYYPCQRCDGGEAVGAVLEAASEPSSSCSSVIIITDNTSPYTLLMMFHKTQSVVGMFDMSAEGRADNVTQAHLSRVISQARQVRRLLWCVTVVVVSDDPAFLATFAQFSLKGRLLGSSTRLLAVTRLPLIQLEDLLSSYWTFSMMNAMFLNMNDATACSSRWTVYVHMPYSRLGAQMVRVASWETGAGLRLHTQLKLFPDKFLNFHGATVNVTARPYTPYFIETLHQAPDGTLTKRYSGMDYILLKTMAKTLNFNFMFLHSDNWDEVTGRVAERVSFMVALQFIVLPQRLQMYDFSFVYELSSMDLCAAKPRLRPQWQSLYYPLADGVWISVLTTILLLPLALYMVNFVATRYGVGEKMDAETAFQMVVATFLNQNLTEKLPKTNTSRVLVTAWLVFAFIIGAAYQGNLTAALTLPKYPPRPETVEDFVNTFQRITIPPWGSSWIAFFRESDSVVLKALAERIVIIPNVEEGLERAVGRKEAHIASRAHLELKIAKYFSRPDGSTQLYVGQESLSPGLSALPIPHDAPYRPQLDRIIRAVLEVNPRQEREREKAQSVLLIPLTTIKDPNKGRFSHRSRSACLSYKQEPKQSDILSWFTSKNPNKIADSFSLKKRPYRPMPRAHTQPTTITYHITNIAG